MNRKSMDNFLVEVEYQLASLASFPNEGPDGGRAQC